MKFILGAFFTLFSGIILTAQPLNGKITNRQGAPIACATVYIREIGQGITADENGLFQINLSSGNYTGEVRSLGYETRSINIPASHQKDTLRICMNERDYQLKEVKVTAKGEDPAYAIMRRTIGLAPWHLKQVNSYESEVYLKGKLKINSIPKILKNKISLSSNTVEIGGEKNKQQVDITKRIFMIESAHQITYQSPGKYLNNIIACKSTVPDMLSDNTFPSVLTESIYEPDAFGCISPLAPDAFSYYRFKLEGVMMEGEHLINKVRIIPRKNNPELLTGYLYIVDQMWSIRQVDLHTNVYGVNLKFNTTYSELKPNLFLPTNYDIDMEINLLGIKAEGKYFTSVQYQQIDAAEPPQYLPLQLSDLPAIDKSQGILTEDSDEKTKAAKKIEELLKKEELSNRDALKMARLMKKMQQPESDRKMEITEEKTEKVNKIDSLAFLRDSSYWSGKRTQPLLVEEIHEYRFIDSLKNEAGDRTKKTKADSADIHSRKGIRILQQILIGNTYHKGDFSFHFNGLLRSVPEYNFVDGFWIGQSIRANYRFNKKVNLLVQPSVYYTTARKELNWYVFNELNYAPFYNGNFSVSLGDRSEDYNGVDGMLPFINSVSSLFFGRNAIRYYRSRFLSVSNSAEIINGLTLTTAAWLEKRTPMINHASYNFAKRTPRPNVLPDEYELMPQNTICKTILGLEYTPFQYYRLRDGKKQDRHSHWPTFSFDWEQAFANRADAYPKYARFSWGVKQHITLNQFNKLIYYTEGGFFAGKGNRFFPDYKHFLGRQFFITEQLPEKSFCISSYRHATDKRWMQAHITWNSQYLLFKRLPFLQYYPLEEGVHLRTLWIPGVNYSEIGYSVGLPETIKLGLFCGFENGKYDAIGFSLIIPMLKNIAY